VDFRLTGQERELPDAAGKFTHAGLPDLAHEMEEKDMPLPHIMRRPSGGKGFLGIKMMQRVRDSFGWGIAGSPTDVQKTNIAASRVSRRFNQRD
jgi:hypothetical protein